VRGRTNRRINLIAGTAKRVIESLPVDGKRTVILVRRDNIEHLVMVGGRNDLVIEPNIMRRPASSPSRRPALEWKGLPPAPTREPFAEPGVKNLQHNLEKQTRRLEAELRGSPSLRRQRTEDPGRDPIQEVVPDGIGEKDPAR
jgi:Flagellar biosynthesis protein, FliO